MNDDEVAACRVDGNGGGAGVVHWDRAVELQTIVLFFRLHLKCL